MTRMATARPASDPNGLTPEERQRELACARQRRHRERVRRGSVSITTDVPAWIVDDMIARGLITDEDLRDQNLRRLAFDRWLHRIAKPNLPALKKNNNGVTSDADFSA